jgi:preprotein translocase subunit YajC
VKIRNLTLALLVATAPFATTAMAQEAADATTTAAATPTVGATVYDTAGAEVGTIKSVTTPNFVIDTGKNTATLALTALGTGPKGPVLGMTKVELDAAAEKAAGAAQEELASAIVADAPVHASDKATLLGKISEVSETDFVLDTGTAKVKLPRTSVAKADNGLYIGMSAEQFADATKSAAAPTPSK